MHLQPDALFQSTLDHIDDLRQDAARVRRADQLPKPRRDESHPRHPSSAVRLFALVKDLAHAHERAQFGHA